MRRDPKKAGIVTIVEPEVLMDGRSLLEPLWEAVTKWYWTAVFKNLFVARVNPRRHDPEAEPW